MIISKSSKEYAQVNLRFKAVSIPLRMDPDRVFQSPRVVSVGTKQLQCSIAAKPESFLQKLKFDSL